MTLEEAKSLKSGDVIRCDDSSHYQKIDKIIDIEDNKRLRWYELQSGNSIHSWLIINLVIVSRSIITYEIY